MPNASNAYQINGFEAAYLSELPEHHQEMIERRSRLLSSAYKLMYRRPLQFETGKGSFLYTPEGVPYLDAYNNVVSLGHCHPAVVDATVKQATRLNTNTRYLDETILDYSELLLGTHADSLDRLLFTCTGSEAIDVALRIAKFHTSGDGIVITRNAYHGVTAAAAAVSPSLGPMVPLGTTVRVVDAPNVQDSSNEAELARFISDVDRAFAELTRHGIKPSALLVDSLFTSDGVRPDPVGVLCEAADVAHAHGAILIADEVQSGFARTGDHMWGYQRHGVEPDIAVMGKPMGNGMPIAGIAVNREVSERFGTDTRYFNTFGANSVSIAAAHATLRTIIEDDLMTQASSTGKYILEKMQASVQSHSVLGAVRGLGMYFGVDVVDPRTGEPSGDLAFDIVTHMAANRVLISATGSGGSTLKIRPPLTFTHEEADMLTDAMDAAAAAVQED